MARATIAAQVVPGDTGYAGAAVTFTTADVANDHQTPFREDILLLARNTGAGAHTVTITSSADSRGRTRDIAAESIAAGAIRVFGPFRRDGWETLGQLYFEADHAEVSFAVVQFVRPGV